MLSTFREEEEPVKNEEHFGISILCSLFDEKYIDIVKQNISDMKVPNGIDIEVIIRGNISDPKELSVGHPLMFYFEKRDDEDLEASDNRLLEIGRFPIKIIINQDEIEDVNRIPNDLKYMIENDEDHTIQSGKLTCLQRYLNKIQQ